VSLTLTADARTSTERDRTQARVEVMNLGEPVLP
jgi:hypothetical protein